MRDAAAGSWHPTTVRGGCSKSGTAEPFLMKAGLTTTRRVERKPRPPPASSPGTTAVSVVPGGTVERTATVKGSSRCRSAWPIARLSPARALTSGAPFGSPGVPTQRRATSEASTASSTEAVARSRPPPTTRAVSSSRAGSTTGDRPAWTAVTFSGSTSTPTTWWPALARQAPVTLPTHPRPNTLTRTQECSPASALSRAAAQLIAQPVTNRRRRDLGPLRVPVNVVPPVEIPPLRQTPGGGRGERGRQVQRGNARAAQLVFDPAGVIVHRSFGPRLRLGQEGPV